MSSDRPITSPKTRSPNHYLTKNAIAQSPPPSTTRSPNHLTQNTIAQSLTLKTRSPNHPKVQRDRLESFDVNELESKDIEYSC